MGQEVENSPAVLQSCSPAVLVCTEGSSLMPLMDNPESSDWKKAVFWQYPRLIKSTQ